MFKWLKQVRFEAKVYRSLRDDHKLTHEDAMVICDAYRWLIQAFGPEDSPYGVATFVLSKVIEQTRKLQDA